MYVLVPNLGLVDPGLCIAANTALKTIQKLPPLLDALIKSFSYFVRYGFIMTEDNDPAYPPIEQHRNKNMDIP